MWLLLTWPTLGTWPTTQASMRPDWESNQQPFGLQPALSPLSHTSEGWSSLLKMCIRSYHVIFKPFPLHDLFSSVLATLLFTLLPQPHSYHRTFPPHSFAPTLPFALASFYMAGSFLHVSEETSPSQNVSLHC